jgi:hypothetical protein
VWVKNRDFSELDFGHFYGFPTGRCLTCENNCSNAVRAKYTPAFSKGFRQFPFVKRNVLVRLAQRVRPVHNDFFCLWHALESEKLWLRFVGHPSQPDVEVIRKVCVGDCIVIWWVSNPR